MEVLEEMTGTRVGISGDNLVFYHHQAMTAATADLIEAIGKRIAVLGRRLCTLVIIGTSVPPPPADIRPRLVRFVRETDAIAMALVVLGKGFAPAAMRAALAGMKMLAGTPYPISVFGTISEATQWLGARSGASVDICAANAREIEIFATPRNLG